MNVYISQPRDFVRHFRLVNLSKVAPILGRQWSARACMVTSRFSKRLLRA